VASATRPVSPGGVALTILVISLVVVLVALLVRQMVGR
jgi:hypothetical protein